MDNLSVHSLDTSARASELPVLRTIMNIKMESPKVFFFAKTTPQRGARALAYEKQRLYKDPLEHIAGMAANKIQWYGMRFEDRKDAAYWQLVLALPKIRQAKTPEAYAYRVAVNHLIRLCNEERDGLSIAVSQLPAPQVLAELEWENLSAGERLESLNAKKAVAEFWKASRLETMISAVRDALEWLPPIENTIVRMFYGIGGLEYSVAEIAGCVGLSLDYVKELKGKALGRLETRLSIWKYAA
jgi:DNA-directed RNA polymerase specialized sigma24 family protein